MSVAPDEPEPDAEVGGPNCCRCGEPVQYSGPLTDIRSAVRDCARCAQPIHAACHARAWSRSEACNAPTLCLICGEWRMIARYRRCRVCGEWACTGCYEWDSSMCATCDALPRFSGRVGSEPDGPGAQGVPSSVGRTLLEQLSAAAVARHEQWMERRYPPVRCYDCKLTPDEPPRIGS